MGVAVKVTDCPEQMVVEDAATETCGVTEDAVMVMALLVAEAGEAQRSEEVITTDTWSLFTRVEEVKVGELEPTFVPLSFHW